ncbi:MAG TPA: ABC transporter permease [Bryobacteraceae bacterium]|nr:ABC transporter permease [Bryobacteraceae bacterium]
MLSWLDAAADVRYAVRALRRSPAFSAVAILALAVGIGASTAVFSAVDLLLFRSLPYPRADRLVSLGFSGPIDTSEFNIGSSYLDWREHQTAFQALTSMYPAGQCDLTGETPLRIHCQQVEANFLRTLGIAPIFGRDFSLQDDRPGAPRVVLLSFALWKSRFGGDPQAVGKPIEIDGGLVRIAGVLPAAFEMPQLGEADVLLPEQMDPRVAHAPNATVFLRTFARLKDGISIEAARVRMLPLFEESLRKDVPPMLRKEVHLVVRGLRDRQIQDARLASWLLFGAVLTLLALACANVANLLLARVAARRGEFAVRAALGAGRGQLLRPMLAESVILSLTGCAAGCVLAAALIRIFIAIAPEGIPRLNQARLDPRVLAFALASSLLVAVLAGLLPAWERLSIDALAGWRTAGPTRARSRQILVTAQVALSLVLVTGASLLLRSLWNLEAEPLGFHPERVLTASLALSRQRYRTPAQQDAFYSELERQLGRIPGVSLVALSDSMPPAGGMHARPFSNMRIFGHPNLPENGGMVGFRYVTPGYFRVLGIPILTGRDFVERERSAADTPLILSATLARRMFGSENPVGQQIDLDLEGHWLPIVGVAGDVKNSGLVETAEPEYYRLRTYNSPQLGRSAVALLQTSLEEATAVRWIRQQIAAVDRDLPVQIESMPQRVNGLSARQRFLAALIALFAGFGLLLAAIGLYGVLSFLVAQRTREIGVRMAVGATPANVAALMGRQAGWWTVCGIAAGLVAAAALARLARGLLFQVPPYDPLSLAAAVAVLLLVSALAAWRPARRASLVDPAISLREQ